MSKKDVKKEKSPLDPLLEKIKSGQVTELNLAKSKLVKAPYVELLEALHTNRTVTVLDIQKNQLGDESARYIANMIRANSCITRLDVSGNSITSLGAKLICEALLEENFTITTLVLDADRGKSSGDDMLTMTKLFDLSEFVQKINLACQSNSHFQKQLRERTGEARLNRRGLPAVPRVVLESTLVTKLDLSLNSLQQLPLALCALTQLEVLFVNGNKLQSLPPHIGRLVNLRKVNVAANQLRELPCSIGLWKHLNQLDIESNQIATLPLALGALTQLQTLKCENNPLVSCDGVPIPKHALAGKDGAALMAFLRDCALLGNGGKAQLDMVRLLILGNERVGKSSLVHALLSPKFKRDPSADKIPPTKCLEITDWTLGESESTAGPTALHFRLWELPDSIAPMYPLFFSSRAIYLLLFALTESAEQNRIAHWLQQIASHAPEAAVLLVGTHADVVGESDATKYVAALQPVLAAYRGKSLSITVAACSTTTGTGLRELVAMLREQLLAQPWFLEHVPRGYLPLQRNIAALRGISSSPVLPSSALFQFATDCQIPPAETKLAAELLAQQGEILYLGADLSELAVLDPVWLARTFLAIVGLAQQQQHTVSKQAVLQQLSTSSAETQRFVLSLLQRFDLLLALSDNDLLLPSLLPVARPHASLTDPVAIELFRKRVWHLFRICRVSSVSPGCFAKALLLLRRRGWRLLGTQYRDGFCVLSKSSSALLSIDVNRNAAQNQCSVIASLLSRDRDVLFSDLLVFSEGVLDLILDRPTTQRTPPTLAIQLACPCCMAPSLVPDLNPLTQLFVDAIESAGAVSWEQVESAAVAGDARIRCERCGKENSTTALAPDLNLSGIPRLNHSIITDCRFVAKGSFSDVFYGKLGSVAVAVKRLRLSEEAGTATTTGVAVSNSTASVSFALAQMTGSTGNVSSSSSNASSQQHPAVHPSVDSILAEFRREAHLMHALRHPNIVQFLGVTLQPLALLQEYMEFGALDKYLHEPERKTPLQTRFLFALDVAAALDFMHRFDPPIIHRDVKTPNVLVTAGVDPVTGQKRHVAKLADFGLAHSMGTITKLHTRVIDNPRWLAPEVIQRSSYDEKVDVYAWAVVAWEIWHQKAAFLELKWWYAMEAAIMDGKRPPLLLASCPPGVCELLSLAWAPEPVVRPSMAEIATRMKTLQDTLKDAAALTYQGPPGNSPYLPPVVAQRRPGSAAVLQPPRSSSPSSVSSPSSSAPTERTMQQNS